MSKKIESKDEAQIIGESELEVVSGGEIDAGGPGQDKCLFIPEKPAQHNGGKDGWVWVQCGSSCMCRGCSCWKTSRCINRWHEMKHLTGSIWLPYPHHDYNHEASDKAVKDSSIPVP